MCSRSRVRGQKYGRLDEGTTQSLRDSCYLGDWETMAGVEARRLDSEVWSSTGEMAGVRQ